MVFSKQYYPDFVMFGPDEWHAMSFLFGDISSVYYKVVMAPGKNFRIYLLDHLLDYLDPERWRMS